MEWIVLIGIMFWIYSTYIYKNSKFDDDETASNRKRYDDLVNELNNPSEETTYFPYVYDRTASSMFMSAADKHKYLQSVKWKDLRDVVLIRDQHKCVYCGSKHNLNCHHINYQRLGNESLSDLVILCSKCHTKLHDLLGYDRTGFYPISRLK